MQRRDGRNGRTLVLVVAALALMVAGAAAPTTSVGAQDATPMATPAARQPTGNGAIFFHPDGTSASHWDAMRISYLGPDARSNWDRLSAIAPYRGHMTDRITGTSNGGAVTHATGTRTDAATFGLDPNGQEYVSANGTTNTIMEEAISAGLGTALLQSGSAMEPGTAAFVAEAPTRRDYEEIVLEVVESGVDIALGGGEEWFLPQGTAGRHCESGSRTDGQNLVTLAEELGYAVVYTRDELMALPADTSKVMGIFACDHTFHDRSEEDLAAEGLPVYVETAPTIAEMIAFALPRVSANPNGFLVVAEEEGSDNLCNAGNASGCLGALKRADDAFGVLTEFVDANPNTFLVTTSDSAAGSMSVVTFDAEEAESSVTPLMGENGGPCDGVEGAASQPFMSAPDAAGQAFPFAICWSTYDDVGSGVIARAHGLEAADLLPATGVSNTDVYRMLYYTLFGEHIR
jgi:alkaline phosphatase